MNRTVPLIGVALVSALCLGCAAEPAPVARRAPARDTSDGRNLRVMSFNLRTSTILDLHNTWGLRKDLLVRTIRRANPDILGTQECKPQQAAYLRRHLPGYGFVGVGRSDGDDSGEMVAIFYRESAFAKRDSGHFWLSTTPGEPGSASWDTFFPRMVSWVVLAPEKGRGELVVFNTHFSAFGDRARRRSAELLERRARAIADGRPTVITGDFNAPPRSRPHRTLVGDGPSAGPGLVDTFAALHDRAGPGTLHGFDGRPNGGRIDWILASGGLEPLSARVVRHHDDGRYPSDHFPVTAVLRRPASLARK